MFTLRNYQQKGVSGIRDSFAGGYRSVLYQLSTGGGKTVIFSYIAHGAVAKGNKVLIMVHRVELLKQTVKSLRSFGLRVGMIAAGYSPDPSAPVQVAMVQTIINRLAIYPHFDLIVTDECHHVTSPTYMKILSFYPRSYQLGVTATPIRSDGKGLGDQYGGTYQTMVLGPPTRELIDAGYLVEPVVFASQVQPDVSQIKRTKRGDFNMSQLGDVMNKKTLTGNAVKHYMDICRNDPAVAFCVSVEHAENTAADFRANGFKFYALSGTTDPAMRERLIRGLGDGSITGITSCDVISEGTDIPRIGCGIMLRPTDSLGLYLQQAGRTLRPCEGKTKAIILDHAGNTFRHGFIDDPRDWTLEGKVKERKSKADNGPPVTQCVECYAVFSSFKKECPQCGHERIVEGREIDQIDGELVEIGAIEKEKLRRQRRTEQGSAKSLTELETFAAKMGYKKGWAKHVHRSREQKAASNR